MTPLGIGVAMGTDAAMGTCVAMGAGNAPGVNPGIMEGMPKDTRIETLHRHTEKHYIKTSNELSSVLGESKLFINVNPFTPKISGHSNPFKN